MNEVYYVETNYTLNENVKLHKASMLHVIISIYLDMYILYVVLLLLQNTVLFGIHILAVVLYVWVEVEEVQQLVHNYNQYHNDKVVISWEFLLLQVFSK